jgi:hypothetical protein
VEHLSGALPSNIRLGWKGLLRTKTLANYGNPYITAVKCFVAQAPWQRKKSYVRVLPRLNVTKLFFYVTDKEVK